MSDGTDTPEPGREPDPAPGNEPAAWPQPSTTPQPEAPWPAGYGRTPGTPAEPAYPAPSTPYGAPAQPAPGAWPGADQSAPPAQPGYAPGYPEQPGAAYPGAAYGSGPYAAGQYAPGPYAPAPQSPRTDGVSIAALVTGLLAMAVVPVVLGIIGLRRTKRNGTQGRGLAIAGIVLGALGVLGWIAVGLVMAFAISTYNNHVDGLRADCAGGDMAACDTLYRDARSGSEEEQFGWTCGGRTEGGGSCEITGAVAYGDSAEFDELWDSCAAGDMAACDTLYSTSPVGSDYEEFGRTCGGLSTGETSCEGGVVDEPGNTDDTGAGDVTGGSHGDDADLDALWDACEAGSGAACDSLYWDSPSESEYEQFGSTCGGRVEFAWSCEQEIGA